MVVNIQNLRETKAKQRFFDYFPMLLREFSLLCGEHGKGKTVTGIYLAHFARLWIEKTGEWSPNVVVVATDIGITEDFGPHFKLTVADFVCQLRGINVVADKIEEYESRGIPLDDDDIETLMQSQRGCPDEKHNPDLIQYGRKWISHEKAEALSEKQAVNLGEKGRECWTSSHGIILFRSIILCDEAHELLSSDMSSSPTVRLMCNFIAKMRHFKITLLVMAPNPKDIARRAREQVTFTMWANTVKHRDWTTGEEVATETRTRVNRGLASKGRGAFTFVFNPNVYFPMYNSHNVLRFTQRALAIGEKYL